MEAGDAFGSAVTIGQFGRDNGRRQLGVSAAREDLGSAKDAGMVGSTYIGEQGSPDPGAQPGDWTQSSAGTTRTPENGDRFGERFSWVQLHIESDDDDAAWPVMLAICGWGEVLRGQARFDPRGSKRTQFGLPGARFDRCGSKRTQRGLQPRRPPRSRPRPG